MKIYKTFLVVLLLVPLLFLSQKLEVIYKLNYKSKKDYYYKLIIDNNNSDFYMINKKQIEVDTTKIEHRNFIVAKRGDGVNIISNENGLKIKSDLDNLKNWTITDEYKKEENFDLRSADYNYDGTTWKGWYIKDMQIPDGPFVFKNLPGLIYSISDKENNYNFTLVSIKKVNNQLYNLDNKNVREMSLEKFKEFRRNRKDIDSKLIEKMLSVVKLDDKAKDDLIFFDPMLDFLCRNENSN